MGGEWEREEVGITRTNSAVDAFRHAFPAGLAEEDRLGVWRFSESIQSQRNITDKAIADFDQGVEKAPQRRQVARDRRLAALASRYGRDGDSIRMLRGSAYNYVWA